MTPFSKIYTVFLTSKVNAYNLMLNLPEIREFAMLEYLKSAKKNFTTCKNKMDSFDETNQCFQEELTDDEIDILADLMRSVWIGNLLHSDDLLRLLPSTKDYSETSQAKMIDSLMATMKYDCNQARLEVIGYQRNKHQLKNLNKPK